MIWISMRSKGPSNRSKGLILQSLALLVFLLAPTMAFPLYHCRSTDASLPPELAIGPMLYTDHSPITINGNAALLSIASSEGWPGTGSPGDPIMISGLRIQSNSPYGISISSTDLHVTISNCNITLAQTAGVQLTDVMNANISFVRSYSNQGDGISLSGCHDCRVENNTLKGAEVVNNYNGISLHSSSDNLIAKNEIMLCVNDGIGLFDVSEGNMVSGNIIKENLNNGIEVQTEKNIIMGNLVLYNRAGIRISGSENVAMQNKPTQNGYGIELHNATSNTISENVLVRNFMGITVLTSYDNTIMDNYVLKSYDYGINVECNKQSFNRLYGNQFFYNNDTGSYYQKGLVQAKDLSGDSIWSSPDNEGNHWWDWRTPDNDENGIVDFPYKLHGNGGKDPYPLFNSTIPDLFTPPKGLSATPGADFINLTWSRPYYSKDIKVIHYNLYRSERGGGEFLYEQLPGSYTSFTDREVVRGRSYYYYITAWNGLAESNRSNRVKSSPDTKGPSIAIVEPEDGAYLNTTYAQLEWSGKDDIKVDRYELSVDGGPFLGMGLNLSIELPMLQDGVHDFKVRIYDLAEHMAEVGSHFTTDTVRPGLEVTGGPNGRTVFSTDRPTIFFRGWDLTSPIKGFHIRNGTGPYRPLGVTDSAVIGPLTDGHHNISVRVEDRAGNWRASSINIIVDTTPPDVFILTPSDGSFLPSTRTEVAWVASTDLSGPLSYELRVDTDDWLSPTTDQSIEIEVDGEGEHGIELKATDGAQNQFTVRSAFVVDLVPPKVDLLVPHDGSVLNRPFFIEWEATDLRSPILLYRVHLDGRTIASIEEGEEGLPVEVSRPDDGEHVIKVEALDSAGNVGSDTASFRYDATPPTIVSVHPTGKDVQVDPFIRVAFSESMERGSVWVDGLPSIKEMVWEGSKAVNVILNRTLAHSTRYELIVHGTDNAGNPLLGYDWIFTTEKDQTNVSGTVLGRTVDETMKPIVNVSLRFRTGERAVSGPDGRFVVEVVPGSGMVTASKADYLDAVATYNVSNNGTVDIGDLVLRFVPQQSKDEEGADLTLLIIIAIILLMAVAIGFLVAYQIRKTKEYAKLPFNEKDVWVNVHIQRKD